VERRGEPVELDDLTDGVAPRLSRFTSRTLSSERAFRRLTLNDRSERREYSISSAPSTPRMMSTPVSGNADASSTSTERMSPVGGSGT